MRWARKSAPGFTFVELIVATAVMLILASAALPIVRVSIKRQREKDLHFTLREMRLAIDKFKDYADSGRIAQFELNFASEHYPASLEQLVEGVAVANDTTGKKFKFLRRIPIDPMTNDTEWGVRSYQDKPDSTSWGGQNAFDVYSKSGGTALNGTKYRDW